MYGRQEKLIMPVLIISDKSEMSPYVRQYMVLLHTLTLKAKMVTEGILCLMQVLIKDVENDF